MRDTRKDQKYFEEYLDYQKSRTEKKIAKLADCDDEKKQRVLVSLTGYLVDLLKAEFSAGAEYDELKKEYDKAIHLVCDYENMTYEDILLLLAFAVLLGQRDGVEQLIHKNEKTIDSDRLLTCFAEYLITGKVTWKLNIALLPEYKLLNDVFQNDNGEIAMKNYLASWYSNHKESAWYNSHVKDTGTYCGYWSFESAAIVKMLSLNEESYKALEYYPSL